jgi:hypothetical protein
MSKVGNPRLPTTDSIPEFRRYLSDYLREIQTQLNGISEGVAERVTNAATAAPTGTTQSYAVGDFVKNATPSELGSASSKYLITGWMCVTAGAPGTWKECRVLTGN